MHLMLCWRHRLHAVPALALLSVLSMTVGFDPTAVDARVRFLNGLGGKEGARFLPPFDPTFSTTTSSSPTLSTSISDVCVPSTSSPATSSTISLLSASASESLSNSSAVMDSLRNKSSFSCWRFSLHATLSASTLTTLSASSLTSLSFASASS